MVSYVVADKGYDDHKLHDFSRYKGFDLVCPIRRYRHTKGERLKLVQFYRSALGQGLYSWGSVSVEPLIEHIKDVFATDPLPVRGYDKPRSVVLLSVLLYQLMIYYNHLTGRPLRALKHMLVSLKCIKIFLLWNYAQALYNCPQNLIYFAVQ